jgi:hypothetical protein
MYDTSPRRPIFTVVTPAASATARRLTTAAKVQAALGISTDTTLIETYIDFVTADVVRYCGLARDAAGNVPTFAAEVVRATYLVSLEDRGTRLILPWRTPITAIASVTEDGVALTVDTDYKLLTGAMLERVTDDTPICWPCSKIIVNYTAGWTLPTNVPAEIEGPVIDQVKMKYLMSADVPGIRSENIPELYAASYSVPGGDMIGKSGLLSSLENSLEAFKAWSAT